MSWRGLQVSPDATHHIHPHGEPVYSMRFDEVLKFHEPGLAPVRKGLEAWHILPDGFPAYRQKFLRTFGFYEERSAVIAPEGWYHIVPDGWELYSDRYAWCGNYQSGRCSVRDIDGLYFHIDLAGRPAYPNRWRYAGDYRDGIAVVQEESGLSTHIGLNGNWVHGKRFVDLDVFHKGYARARDEDGWIHIDIHGCPAYSRRFAAVEPFYNGQARVERHDGGLEVISETGATIVELRPARRSEFTALSGDMVGFWRTHTIATAVRVGLIEALPSTPEDVAPRCNLHADGASRLLWALNELGIVQTNGGLWELTSRGQFLKEDHPLTLAGAALEYAGPLLHEWRNLDHALRKGSDWAAPDVFEVVGQDASRRDGHHRMLRSYALHDYNSIPTALALAGKERIIDAAGGLGTLGELILNEYPTVHVTVLERPEVVHQALELPPSHHGLSFLAGNIFKPWELDADAVILSRVLHDWDDEASLTILRHARTALPVGGRIFVIEMLRPDGCAAGALCDLHLLVVSGGKERNLLQFKMLFGKSGFELQEAKPIAALPTIIVGVAV